MSGAETMLIGPIVCRSGGFAFDIFSAGRGLIRGFVYRRVEQAHYDRRATLAQHRRTPNVALCACETEVEFSRQRDAQSEAPGGGILALASESRAEAG